VLARKRITGREAILRAPHRQQRVLGGPHGAASRLGRKRATPESRIRKCAIDRSTA